MSGGPAGPTVWLIDPRAHVPEYDRSLGAALERLGCRVRLCVGPSWPDSTGGRTVPGRERRDGAAGVGRGAAALRYPLDLLRLVGRARRERPDVVHWQWSVEPPLDALAMRALRRTGAATVLTLHNVLPHEWRPGQRQARDLLARHAEVVIVHSRASANRLVRELPECAGRTRVVPMSSDRPSGPRPSRQEARALLGLELTAGDRLVLFFGQVRPYKGLPVLLEAIELCRRVDGRVHLLVAGRAFGRVAAGGSPGPVAVGAARAAGGPAAAAGGAAPRSRPGRRLERAIRSPSAGRTAPVGSSVRGPSSGGVPRADGVIWRLGARPEAEVPLLFAACDVVALPYLRTDDSAVLPQALAHGRAVVASAVGGLPEALSRGGGELVPSGDAAALSAALLGLLTDGDRLLRLEAAAAASASAWSWDDAARATCRVYAGLLAGPVPPAVMSDRDGLGQDRPVGPTGPDRTLGGGRSWPLVTVVLPVRDEEARLAATLGALLGGDYPRDRLEVLVVDGRSADGTAALARGFAERDRRVKVLDNPGRSAAHGLNVGLAAAAGAVIVRLDGHSIPAPDYVRACVATLERTGAWVVGGRMAGFGRTWFGRAVAAVHGTRLGSGGAAWRTGDDGPADTVYLGAWPRWVLDRVGGWDPGLERNQDSELCLRIRAAGGLVWLDRSIRTRTVARDRPDALWRQYFGYGAGRAATLARHPGSLGARQAVPAAATAVAVVLVALAPWSGRAARWLGGLVAAWCAAVLVSVASAAPREPRSVLARMPAAYAIMHLAWGAGFWVGLVRQADRRRGPSARAGREAPRG